MLRLVARSTPVAWPSATDVTIAAAFAVVAEVELRVSSQNIFNGTVSLPVDTVLVLLPVVFLAWRRAAPFAAVVAVAAAITVTGGVFHGTICFFGGLGPFLVSLYTASAWARPPLDRFAALVPLVMLALMPTYVQPFRFPADLVFGTVVSTAAWTAGQLVRRWRQQSEQLEAALQAAQRHRDTQARLAVAEERGRIARELHDVVAHGMSVMVMQAGLARLDLRTSPDVADRSLDTIERTGRQSLLEMRRLLGVLRSADTADLAPQPRMADLPTLVDTFRTAGLDVQATVVGAPRVLGEAQDLSAYRIVQEALTNALKHGCGHRAQVTVAYLPDRIDITVTNPARPGVTPAVDGAGQGLVGIRERTALFADTCRTVLADGSFLTQVALPLDEASG